MKTKIKNNLVYLFILFFILLGLVSCGKKKNEVKEKNKIIIESFDYEISRSKATVPNELSYILSFDINFTLNQKFDVDDFVVRIATQENKNNKKSFHFDIEYSNTEKIIKSSPSIVKYPYILLNYAIVDTTTLNVEAQLKITSMDLIDDINNFIKIDCFCESTGIVDEKHILNNGIFKMSFSDDSPIYYEFDEFSESSKVISALVKTDSFEIQETYKGYPVTTIGEGAFYGCTFLKSITIPNSVTRIEADAFRGCNNLTSITIPKSANIADTAFLGCDSLTNIYYEGSIVDWCKMSFNKGHIFNVNNSNHFYLRNNNNEWEEVTNINIPMDMSLLDLSIGEYQFYGFNNIVSVDIPFMIRSIAKNSFEGCVNIERANIPAVGIQALPKDNIKDVIINFGSSIDDAAFKGCNMLRNIVIYESITNIGKDAFEGCINIESANIPSAAIESIPKNNLKKVIINGGKVIPYGAFSGCSSLTRVEISNSITNVMPHAFEDCNCLTSITIPDSITSIESSSFNGCSSLSNVYFDGTIKSWCKGPFTGMQLFFSSLNSNHFYMRNSNNEWKEVTSIMIPNSITEIGAGKFSKFNNVASITIPNSVTSIGEDAFYNCSSLTSIIIPNSVTSIGKSAFAGCSGLVSIVISESVTSIGGSAFEGCSSLANIYYEGTMADWCNILFNTQYSWYSNPMAEAEHFYIRNSNNEWEEVTSIEIPNSITEIRDYQFCGFSSIVSITIPKSVTSIGENAFYGCYRLVEVYNLSSLDMYAKVIHTSLEEQSNLIIKDDYVFIKDNDNKYYLVEYNGTTTDLVLPNDIEGNTYEINTHAFYNCSSLTSIDIPNGVTNIGGWAFYNCSSLTSAIIGNGVSSIGWYAFSDCSSLTSVTILDSVTKIDDSAFSGCSSLESIIIPDSVTKIDDSAFSGCSSLEFIIIPDSVTSIGDYVFRNCSSLANVYYKGRSDGWKNVSIGPSNSSLTSATIYYYSETMPTEEGNYWHYVDGIATKW